MKNLDSLPISFWIVYLLIGFISSLRFTYVMRVKQYSYADIFVSLLLSIVGPGLMIGALLIKICKLLDKPVFKSEGPMDWYKSNKKEML